MPSYKMKRRWKKSTKSWKSLKLDHAQNSFLTICRKAKWSSVENQVALFTRWATWSCSNWDKLRRQFSVRLAWSMYQRDWTCVGVASGFDPSKYDGPNPSSFCSVENSLPPYHSNPVKREKERTQPVNWCKKRSNESHEFTSILDRWQNDEIFRTSQLAHGWIGSWVKYLDYISKIDISHEALYRQRQRYESTLYMRRVDSRKHSGPLCQRPDYRPSADALVSLQRAQGKGVPHIPMHMRTRQNNTLDPAVQQHSARLSFNWKTFSRHLHPQHGQKGQHGGVANQKWMKSSCCDQLW